MSHNSFQHMKEQLNVLQDLGVTQFDCLMARYNPELVHTAGYIEKEYLYKLSYQDILAKHTEFLEKNQKHFNIYIRDSLFAQSKLLVLDDCMAPTEHDLLYKFKMLRLDIRVEFILLTSGNNYQVGITHTGPQALSALLLQSMCDSLSADKKHAKIGKFFRLAGFENKKPVPHSKLFDLQKRKDFAVKFKKI